MTDLRFDDLDLREEPAGAGEETDAPSVGGCTTSQQSRFTCCTRLC